MAQVESFMAEGSRLVRIKSFNRAGTKRNAANDLFEKPSLLLFKKVLGCPTNRAGPVIGDIFK
jgi:hypothetical protein